MRTRWRHVDKEVKYCVGPLFLCIDEPNEGGLLVIYGIVWINRRLRFGWPLVI